MTRLETLEAHDSRETDISGDLDFSGGEINKTPEAHWKRSEQCAGEKSKSML